MGIVLNSQNRCVPHASEEILEEYVLHRLPEALAAQVEEHLLICHECQDALALADDFVGAMKSAPTQSVPIATPALWSFHNLAAPVAVMLSALILVWYHPQNAPGSPAAVSLSSFRAVKAPVPAPAGKPLSISIEIPDLLPAEKYDVQVVDSAGTLVWSGPAAESDGKLVATVSQPLGTGMYWVRLYRAHSTLLREFSLRTE